MRIGFGKRIGGISKSINGTTGIVMALIAMLFVIPFYILYYLVIGIILGVKKINRATSHWQIYSRVILWAGIILGIILLSVIGKSIKNNNDNVSNKNTVDIKSTYDNNVEHPTVELAETPTENTTESATEKPTEKPTESIIETSKQNQTSKAFINRDLNGRGISDEGRDEPHYVNTAGYAVIYSKKERELSDTDEFTDTNLWTVPTFEPDKQFMKETTITLPHKTEVKVLEQTLKHEGWGRYSGYLLVKKLDDDQKYYIDVSNYITKPYWTYNDDLEEAAMVGMFIAEYKQISDYYPVSSSGEKVTIEEGTKVLVKGTAGHSKYIEPDQTGIEAIVWKDWKLGYGGVTVYFNDKDLTIVY